MGELRVQVALGPTATRVVASEQDEKGSTVILRAALSASPSHPRSLQWLLEAVALWQGTKVHAVLSAEPRHSSCATPLWDEWFGDFGTGALYTLELAPLGAKRVHRDRVGPLTPRPKQLRLFGAKAARRSR